MDFYQFWNKLNGEMYKDIPRPVQYDFADYMSAISPSGSPLNGSEDGTWALTPLSMDDMATTAAQDVVDWQKEFGTNTTKLGSPMTDDELRRFYGNPH